MKVPFIDIKRHEPGFVDAVTAKFSDLVSQSQYIGGKEVQSLEERLCALTGTQAAVTCANGTDALQLALRALDMGHGDTVLVPDVTFWATFEAVVNVGASPVTVDADLADGGVNFDAFVEAVERVRPKAAIIAHLYGWGTSRIAELRDLCRANDVKLVEDGAQCFGTEHNGQPLLAGALVSTTSFYPAKVFGAAGDGGAVMTDDHDLAARVRQLANHGRTSHYGYGLVGWNSRMDSLQAAYLNLSAPYLPDRIASRRVAAQYYRDTLPTLGVTVMAAPAGYVENGYCNVCLFEDAVEKARLEDTLRNEGIGFGNIYPSALSEQPGAKDHLKAHIGGTVGQTLSGSVVNLPLFPYMTEAELEHVVAVVRQGLGK